MWSRNYAACVRCGGTSGRDMGSGVCTRCYLKAYRAANAARIAEQKRAWYLSFVAGTDKQKLDREQRHFDGLREQVLTRDDSRCVQCGSQKSLVVHHKDGIGRGSAAPNNDLDNLVTLCRSCHIASHRAELLEVRQQNAYRHSKLERWARQWDACRRCGTTTIAHSAHGLCRSCIRYKKTFKI